MIRRTIAAPPWKLRHHTIGISKCTHNVSPGVSGGQAAVQPLSARLRISSRRYIGFSLSPLPDHVGQPCAQQNQEHRQVLRCLLINGNPVGGADRKDDVRDESRRKTKLYVRLSRKNITHAVSPPTLCDTKRDDGAPAAARDRPAPVARR